MAPPIAIAAARRSRVSGRALARTFMWLLPAIALVVTLFAWLAAGRYVGTDNAYVKGDRALIATEKVTLDFTPEAIRAIARIACQVNESVENIGARRLQTVMERLLEELSFEAEDRAGETISIDAAYVRERLADLARDSDLSKYIL